MLRRYVAFWVYLCGMCVALALWVGALYSDGRSSEYKNCLNTKCGVKRPTCRVRWHAAFFAGALCMAAKTKKNERSPPGMFGCGDNSGDFPAAAWVLRSLPPEFGISARSMPPGTRSICIINNEHLVCARPHSQVLGIPSTLGYTTQGCSWVLPQEVPGDMCLVNAKQVVVVVL